MRLLSLRRRRLLPLLAACAALSLLAAYRGCRAPPEPPPELPDILGAGSGLSDVPSNASRLGQQSAACQPIHVSLVVAGYTATRYAVIVVKSLLFHRKNPIHLHLVVTANARKVLETLFTTWRIPQLVVSYYSAEALMPSVSWVQTSHYSGVYGLLKLALPDALSADRVILLDTDVVIAADIAELWAQFDSFNDSQCLGVTDNLSDWYLGKTVWPAIGRGFNTGVMLMRVACLRRWGWAARWPAVARRRLAERGPAQLADQDVVNSLLLQHRRLLRRLPCFWNLQLGDRAQPELCYQRPAHLAAVKVLHWNSRAKVWSAKRHKFAQHFHTLYMTYLGYDGGLLRRQLFACPDWPSADDPPADVAEAGVALDPGGVGFGAGGGGNGGGSDECYEMRAEQRLVRRTHLYYLDYNYTAAGSSDVTLVSQLSLDRVQLLETLSRHWTGPISLCVYVTDAEAHQLTSFVESSQVLRRRRNIGYHLLMKEGQFYPVNHLRNVAMENAPTEHVFLLDFDFLPSVGLYEHLRAEIARQGDAQRVALIVPAFETFQYKLRFPASKAELLGKLNLGEIVPFRQEVFKEGHRATDFTRWKSATQSYSVAWQADFEPYVVIGRDAARFDTRFVGFGWNKVSFIMQLDILGFHFRVLPNAFVVHLPHAPSLDVARFRFMPEYRHCINTLKVEYIKFLAKKHGVRALKYLSFRKDLGSLSF